MDNNIKEINNNIMEAVKNSNRDKENVELIAVSKTRTVEEMKKVVDLGLVKFGENRAQEFREKHEKFDDDIIWHFIGHLQRNKVKYLVGKVSLIHSVDSVRLAKAINKEAIKENLVQDVLLQFNISKEKSKYGFYEEDLTEIIKEIKDLKNLNAIGLMTMAPHTDNSEESREYFKGLRQLSVDINSQKIDNMNIRELSMGMTSDYKIAIQEGATMIRIGTAIFGERSY